MPDNREEKPRGKGKEEGKSGERVGKSGRPRSACQRETSWFLGQHRSLTASFICNGIHGSVTIFTPARMEFKVARVGIHVN